MLGGNNQTEKQVSVLRIKYKDSTYSVVVIESKSRIPLAR